MNQVRKSNCKPKNVDSVILCQHARENVLGVLKILTLDIATISHQQGSPVEEGFLNNKKGKQYPCKSRFKLVIWTGHTCSSLLALGRVMRTFLKLRFSGNRSCFLCLNRTLFGYRFVVHSYICVGNTVCKPLIIEFT